MDNTDVNLSDIEMSLQWLQIAIAIWWFWIAEVLISMEPDKTMEIQMDTNDNEIEGRWWVF